MEKQEGSMDGRENIRPNGCIEAEVARLQMQGREGGGCQREGT